MVIVPCNHHTDECKGRFDNALIMSGSVGKERKGGSNMLGGDARDFIVDPTAPLG